MALSAKIINRLKSMGINTTEEKIARKKLLKILTDNNVPDCDEDPIDSLIEMASVFAGDAAEEVEDEEEVTEDEADGAEEEEEAPVVKKKGGSKPAPVSAKKPAKKAAVVEEEDDEADEEEEMDDLVEEVKGKNLKSGSAKTAPAPKKPTAKKTATHKRKLTGTRWEDLTDEQKEKALVPFRKAFPAKQFKIALLQKSFTVTYLGKTSEQNICKYHLLRLQDNKKLEGVFVSHRFKDPTEFAGFLSEEIVAERTLKQGDSCSYIHPFTQDEVFELINETDWLKESIVRAEQQDKKMQQNRANLEKTLNEGTPKKTTTKKAAVIVEDSEDEEEEEAPAPKATKKSTTNKTTAATNVKSSAKKPVIVETEEEEEEEEPAPAPKKKAVAGKKK